jgi:hypothetical protein
MERPSRFVSETPGTALALRCPCGEVIDSGFDLEYGERIKVLCPSCRRVRIFDSSGTSLDFS